uniref:Uncharacterized protein n=1 Tax=Timspurckia oligopyrenoides TaxID=708627 RepID=A0A7S0ZHS8_9RHOD|mmetsp:Transcript_5861/g.10399  ORF Transcript_5861/g.10399 Transcript_5861/m.10399 type:complete len:152 (+) Transcript_5861:132-587(+)
MEYAYSRDESDRVNTSLNRGYYSVVDWLRAFRSNGSKLSSIMKPSYEIYTSTESNSTAELNSNQNNDHFHRFPSGSSRRVSFSTTTLSVELNESTRNRFLDIDMMSDENEDINMNIHSDNEVQSNKNVVGIARKLPELNDLRAERNKYKRK